MSTLELFVGDFAFSTWSLRPWLVLKRCGADFTVTEIKLDRPDTAKRIAEVSGAGRVPVLRVDGEAIWDSLAIAVWCAERWPEAGLWPAHERARWLARSVCCEMHSGFAALRTECNMGPDSPMAGPADGRSPLRLSPSAQADLVRLVTLWRQMRERFGEGGPWLFGTWGVADAFFTPVAARVRRYGLDLEAAGDDGTARAYVEALLAQPDFREWERLTGA